MKTPAVILEDLRTQRPEWRPWLALVEATRREAESDRWEATVPTAPPSPEAAVPLLEGVTVALDRKAARRFFDQLLETAARDGTPKMTTLRAALDDGGDEAALFVASVRQDGAGIAAIAGACGADAEALQAVVSLFALPFLHACGRRWKPFAHESWTEGYCPTCGSWPAFAEVRGIERTRCLRCGRCGDQWQALPLRCPYCRTIDHERLARLVPEVAGPHAIDVCRDCLGYVKTFTKLQGCAPTAVMPEDLASVDLDLAAVSLGYKRPEGCGYSIDIFVADAGARRRLFAWNA